MNKDFSCRWGCKAVLLFAVSLVLFCCSSAGAATVKFPLRIDYPLLRSLVVSSLFTDPGPSLMLVDPADDCRRIMLSDPRLAWTENRLRLDMAVNLQGGTTVGQNCLFPVEWSGYLRAYPKARIDAGTWRLSFEWQDTELLDANRQPARAMNKLWNVFKGPVLQELNALSIDLNPPLDALPSFLLEMTSEADRARIKRLINSIKPNAISTTPDALVVAITGNIDLPEKVTDKGPAEPLTEAELDGFIRTWETWDAFLVNTMLALSGEQLTPAEQEILFEVLIETRYRFVAELSKNTPGPDFVRHQFVWAWEKLSPVLRNHLHADTSGNPWAYLAYFTASDALAALDQLGPAISLDVSRDGLIRLARLIADDDSLVLDYTPAVNTMLRNLLGLGPPLDATGPVPDARELELNRNADSTMQRSVADLIGKLFAPRNCWASTGPLPGIKELRQWLVPKDNLQPYLRKVKGVLKAATEKHLRQSSIPKAYHDLFEQVVYATAWQETCFRQFVVRDRKLVYIESYNNTSVGLMQINERVWRGVYNIQHLRWNIQYNAEAGVDILARYFTKYAMPKGQTMKALGTDGLAACIYAMYNGGPSQFNGYLKRHRSGKYYKTDKHFREKYEWVKNGRWDRLSLCLIGR